MATRIASIESFRVLAILSVILWHTDFLGRLQQLGGGRLLVNVSVYLVWWVGVPYFCLAAGYFFGKSLQTHGNPLAHLRRYSSHLVWILLAWLCVYTVIPSNWPAEVRDHGLWQPFYSEALKNLSLLATHHVRLFLVGASPVWHLWFLPALIFSLATLTLIEVCRLQRYVIPLIIGFYVLAVTEEVLAIYSLNSSFHLGLWSIAILLTALGWWLAGRGQPSVPTALCLIVGGYAFALMEAAVMREFFHSSPIEIFKHNYLGGIVLALGIFLLTLAKPHWGQSTPLPFLAQFTLGVYVSHTLVIHSLIPISWRLQSQFPLWQLLFSLAVYFLAVLFTLVLSKVSIARYLVTRTAPGTWTQYQDEHQLLTKANVPDSCERMPQVTINRGLIMDDGMSPAPFRYGRAIKSWHECSINWPRRLRNILYR